MTNPPPVAPVEGHYALLRNGNVVGPLEKSCIEGFFSCQVGYEVDEWRSDGKFYHSNFPNPHDIIATISPEAMQAAADGTYERILAVESTLAAIHAICLETGPRWSADEAMAKITQLVEASDGD